MRHLEHKEQVALCKWLDARKVRYFAIPNGGARDAVTGARLKAEGVKPGVPDLFIPEMRLFIEMKRRDGGATTNAQKEWAEYLRGEGYRVEVCRGWIEAKDQIEALIREPRHVDLDRP